MTGYRVTVSDGRTWDLPATQTSKSIPMLDPLRTYTATVQALNLAGPSDPASVNFTTPTYVPVDSDADGIPDSDDTCPSTPGAGSPTGCPLPPPIGSQPPPADGPAAGSPAQSAPAPAAQGPSASVRVKRTSGKSKLHVDVNPNKGAGYWTFQVQRLEPAGTWKPLKTYRTTGSKETRTVNLPKGTYQVVIAPKYGHSGITSSAITLTR